MKGNSSDHKISCQEEIPHVVPSLMMSCFFKERQVVQLKIRLLVLCCESGTGLHKLGRQSSESGANSVGIIILDQCRTGS